MHFVSGTKQVSNLWDQTYIKEEVGRLTTTESYLKNSFYIQKQRERSVCKNVSKIFEHLLNCHVVDILGNGNHWLGKKLIL